jgi:hypothetical protein
MDNAAVYEAVRTGTGYRELAAQLGKTQPAVRAMAGRYARANHLASPTVARDLGLKGTVEPAPDLKAAERTAPAVVVRPNAPALTDLTYLDPATDQGVFLERLHAARADGGYATVAHVCDIHAPYQHAPALDVTYQLLKYVWPRFIVVGSDFFDFSSLSAFPQDADDAERDDALDALETPWNAHISALTKASPASTLVFVLGNHEKRIFDFINRQAPQVRHTVWRRFVQIVRCGGRVLWLGETDTVRFGPLRVMHGNRHNVHVAQSLLQDTAYQLNVMAGHVHRLTFANKRGDDFPVSAITSGCLCHWPSAYMKRKTPTQKWMLGTALAEVNLRGRDVHLDNLEYQMDSSAVWARFERRTFSAAIPAPTGLISFEDWIAAKQRAA